jgi:hypothetical protein
MRGDRTNYGAASISRNLSFRVYGDQLKQLEKAAKAKKVSCQDIIKEFLDAEFPWVRKGHPTGGEDRKGAGRCVDGTRQQKRRAAQSAAKGAKAGNGKARPGPGSQKAPVEGRKRRGYVKLPSGKSARQQELPKKPRRVVEGKSPEELIAAHKAARRAKKLKARKLKRDKLLHSKSVDPNDPVVKDFVDKAMSLTKKPRGPYKPRKPKEPPVAAPVNEEVSGSDRAGL